MATITALPASGAIEATKDFVKVTVAAADQNSGSFDPTAYPTTPEMRYYLTFEKSSAIQGKSYVFGVDETGGHVFSNYVFPSTGSWTIRLSNARTDASVATLAVTVI